MRALIVVDIQNDFLPGGALAVPDGDQVIEVANRMLERYPLAIATQDWHPPDHRSFAAEHGLPVGDVVDLDGLPQVLWPVHCVQGTPGAELAADLEVGRIARVVRKGTDPRVDSYSGFFDNGRRRATELDQYLREHGVEGVDILGLATDYCVKFTALDAASLGYQTRVIVDGCRGVELQPGDVENAIAELLEAGVKTVDSAAV